MAKFVAGSELDDAADDATPFAHSFARSCLFIFHGIAPAVLSTSRSLDVVGGGVFSSSFVAVSFFGSAKSILSNLSCAPDQFLTHLSFLNVILAHSGIAFKYRLTSSSSSCCAHAAIAVDAVFDEQRGVCQVAHRDLVVRCHLRALSGSNTKLFVFLFVSVVAARTMFENFS